MGIFGKKTFCPGVPSGHSGSHFSPVRSVPLCFQDSPEVASHYGFRLRVGDLPSKSGLGANEAPENQHLGYSSLSALLSYLLDSQPKHSRRTGTLKACPSVGKREAQGSGSSGFLPGPPYQFPFCCPLWLSLPLSGPLALLCKSSFFLRKSQPAFAALSYRFLPQKVWESEGSSFCILCFLV